jgi:hypothetical protein
MKVELTIKCDYLPNWGVYEGCRELVQNGKDAETELGAKLTVTHTGNKLYIENEGATLPHEALLLGHTTKLGRGDTIGKFGEGLKLGILALVRAGHAIKIRSGSEVWIPRIERSERFNADVLTFTILKNREPKNRVRIEIGGIDSDSWKEFKKCFLFLCERENDDRVTTTAGTLLLAPRFKGRVFVKGIFVSNDPSLVYGYDLRDADLDRDRRMLASYELSDKTRRVWEEAIAVRPDLFESFWSMLSNRPRDVEGISSWNVNYLPTAAVDSAVEKFRSQYGDDAVPVATLGDSKEMAHFGKRGIVVNETLGAVLARVMGTTANVKAALREEVTRRYGYHEICDKPEGANLDRAIEIVNAVRPLTWERVDVVDFRSSDLRGMHKDGRLLIAHKILADRAMALRVLVHEIAHDEGADGEKSHVSTIESIWSAIVANLTK